MQLSEATTPVLASELSTLLRRAADYHRDADEAMTRLQSVYAKVEQLPDIGTVFTDVYGTWLLEILKRYETSGKGIGHASLEMKHVPEDLRDIRELMYPFHQNKAGACPVNAVMEWFNGDRLAEALQSESDGLEDRGIVEAANHLVESFGLRGDWNSTHRPKRTGRYVIFPLRIYSSCGYGYDYRQREDLHHIAKSLSVAGEDSGVSGVGDSAHAVAEAFTAHSKRFDSRTRIGDQGVIDAVVFNEKIEYRVSHDVGDSLCAFIKLHSTLELYEF